MIAWFGYVNQETTLANLACHKQQNCQLRTSVKCISASSRVSPVSLEDLQDLQALVFLLNPGNEAAGHLRSGAYPNSHVHKMQVKTFKKCNNTTLQQYGKQGHQYWSSENISGSAFSPLPPCLLLFRLLQVFQPHPGRNRNIVGICVGGHH